MTTRIASRTRRHNRNRYALGALVEALELRTLLSAGPRITGITPTESISTTFDHVVVTWNEPIDPTTFTTGDVSLTGPPGSITVSTVTKLDELDYQINFDSLSERGTYQIAIGPNIADPSGNLMDQNEDGTRGESTADQFRASLNEVLADTVFTAPVVISESNTSYDGQNIAIKGTNVAINGAHNFSSVQLIDGAILTHSADSTTQTHKLDLTVANQVVVDATSRIDVSGEGYLYGRTTGNTTVGAAIGGSGGSYGGTGGGGASNAAYGDYADPADWGSGAGASSRRGGWWACADHRWHARARWSVVSQRDRPAAAGGSGGGIYVAVATLSGTGQITAAGAANVVNSSGAGGGGRIAVYAADFTNFDLAKITAPSKIGNFGSPGGAGTVFIKDTDESRGTLIIDAAGGGNGTTPLGLAGQDTATFNDPVVIRGTGTNARPEHSGMNLVFAQGLIVSGSGQLATDAMLTVADSLAVKTGGGVTAVQELNIAGPLTVDGAAVAGGQIVASSVSVTNGGVLTSLSASTTVTHTLDLQVTGTLSVDTTSRIDVSGEGYLYGRTTGNTTVGAAIGGSGGSYGGTGGGGASNAAYGDYADPADWGSGAGASSGGVGGGLVRITAGTLALDGQLLANGTGRRCGRWFRRRDLRGGGDPIGHGSDHGGGCGKRGQQLGSWWWWADRRLCGRLHQLRPGQNNGPQQNRQLWQPGDRRLGSRCTRPTLYARQIVHSRRNPRWPRQPPVCRRHLDIQSPN